MKKVVPLFALVAMLCLTMSAAFAEDKAESKEVTLKGTAVCAKCELGKTSKCQDALKVTEDGKDVIYYISKDDSSKDLHGKICKAPKENVSVTGVVSEKDGQKWIKPSKIE